MDKPTITLDIYLADYAPITSLLNIISEMIEDDRIPAEYRFKILKALAPCMNAPKKIAAPE